MYLLTKTVIFFEEVQCNFCTWHFFFFYHELTKLHFVTALLSFPQHDEMHLGNRLEVNAGIAAITCRLLEFYFLDVSFA